MEPVVTRAGRRLVPFLVAAALALALPAAVLGDDPGLPDSSGAPRDSVLPDPAVRDTLAASAEPFKPGESLRFQVQYGVIHAGTAWLEVPETTAWNSHRVWRLVARAESNSFFSSFYRVRIRIESLWDLDSRFSWHYFEDRHEGGHVSNDTMTYEPDSSRMRYKSGQTFTLPGPVQDALSSFYLTRFQALPIGGRVAFEYHASHKTAVMEVLVLRRETVKTPAGRFACVVIEPQLKAGGIFKNNGRLRIWLTEDERRMPVKMESKVAIGSIKVVLQEAKTGG
jgi:hypothetical protein